MIPGVIIIDGHVQGLSNTRSIGEMGVPVIVLDKGKCIARYSKYCVKYFKSPEYLSEEFIDFLIEVGRKEGLQDWILLPSNDHAVYNISRNKEKLSRVFKTIVPDFHVYENIYDKEKLIRKALQCNFPVPESWFPTDTHPLAENVKFPCLLKGKRGLNFYKAAGKKAFLVSNENELQAKINLLKQSVGLENIFIQNLIPSTNSNFTISFSVFAIDSEIKAFWAGEKLREHPEKFGTASYCKSIDVSFLKEQVQVLLKELNYTGICEVEIMKDPRDNLYKLIEINARTWLWVGLAKKCGVNFPKIIYNYLNKIDFDIEDQYKYNVKWMHYVVDIPFSLLSILKGNLNIFKWIGTYLKFPSPAVFNKRDLLPTFAELWLIPYFLRKR